MQCTSCSNELPAGVAYCPSCGAATSDQVSEAGISPYDLTAASSYAAPPPVPASTDYGSSPYGMSQSYPYDPYAAPLPPPPPPPSLPSQPSLPPRRKARPGIIIGVVILVLAIVGASAFALFTQLAKSNSPAKAVTPTTTTAQTGLTATATPTTSSTNTDTIPYPPYKGKLVLNDALHNNNQGYGWDVYAVDTYGGACQFAKDGYHVFEQQKYVQTCRPTTGQFGNVALEVQMKVIKGNCGGVTFRDDGRTAAYHFEVCQDGTFMLYRYDASGSATTELSDSSTAIKKGLNQSNLLAVVAINAQFDLYINGQHIDSISDNTLPQGYIGLRASYYGSVVEVVYSNIKVWTL